MEAPRQAHAHASSTADNMPSDSCEQAVNQAAPTLRPRLYQLTRPAAMLCSRSPPSMYSVTSMVCSEVRLAPCMSRVEWAVCFGWYSCCKSFLLGDTHGVLASRATHHKLYYVDVAAGAQDGNLLPGCRQRGGLL
jgi:hypothetical protein